MTERIVVDSNGRKHITNEPQLHPPKREWVGLTDEDINIAFDDTQEGGGFDDFARAIEATLKRKNT